MDNELVFKIIFTVIVIIFISITVIKRFCYFKPIEKYIETKEKYVMVKHKHIFGWVLNNNKSDKIIVFCHGYNGNISHRENKYIELKNMGYSVITFDYSGYGKTQGIPSEQQLYEDASSIMSMVKKNYINNNIIVYGESMGGPVAVYVARRFNIPKIILESPLISMKSVLEKKCFLFKYISFLFDDFDIKKYLIGYNGEILLLHGINDEIVPYESIFEIKDYITKYIPIQGTHKFPVIPWDQIKHFLE
jgi:cephalosporin-C deacetylase-like acetyl esterase